MPKVIVCRNINKKPMKNYILEPLDKPKAWIKQNTYWS